MVYRGFVELFKKRFVFESPSLMVYNGEVGSMWSIILRMILIWNAGNLVFEYVYYPYDLKALLTKKSRKIE